MNVLTNQDEGGAHLSIDKPDHALFLKARFIRVPAERPF